ncbi:polysaccharide pyruvyl transferase family protein [Sanguibacter antarcticus]|uniref:Polysaccharide pyruvyl transferase WcaK-like protein n=1 Tax=Sanguibacter antarcticus TaxID=372484 RepID=A0A2A9DZY1_9MICO|nr:polysaccharide pyruvyl transferase family protein [Sanguibacter antarcticus]PFG32347.1 polysaccharide pyruvyl transferase WcaK-like protein [Sanguibacter antarcticus]
MRRDHSPESSRADLEVLVFGELGIGNLGNEASLTEALRRLEMHLPGARVRVLSYDPARTALEHHGEHPRWSTEPISAPQQPRAGRQPGRWGRLARQLTDSRRVAHASRGADLVVVPGTGIFEELWTGPWGVPVLLVGLAAGARARRVPLVVVAVGADLPRRRLTRWMFSFVLRSSAQATFRDGHSRAAGAAMLADGKLSRRRPAGRRPGAVHRAPPTPRLAPDLVLGAPPPHVAVTDAAVTDAGSRPRLVLGVMRYYGTSDDATSPEGVAVHERYRAALTDTAARILARGWTVDIVVGDDGDLPVAHDLASRLGPGTTVRPVTTMHDLDAVIAGATVVVASRYHNVVSAVRAAVPVMSVSYTTKGHALMEQVGMVGASQWIEKLDAQRLTVQIDDVVTRSGEIAAQLREATHRFRATADDPWRDAASLTRTAGARPAQPVRTTLVEETA